MLIKLEDIVVKKYSNEFYEEIICTANFQKYLIVSTYRFNMLSVTFGYAPDNDSPSYIQGYEIQINKIKLKNIKYLMSEYFEKLYILKNEKILKKSF